MHACASTLIAAYGYDPQAKDLDIEFKSGPTWRYADVPPSVFLDFLRSDSKGKFLNASIKGKYAERKLSV